MARNKHPEETVNLILDVALALFFEKGYDNTSIQDIIDGLGGLTKGAVYHHFKSKEDILSAALDRDNQALFDELRRIRDDGRMTGAEKLQALFAASITGPQMDMWAKAAPDVDPVKNARLLGLQYQAVLRRRYPISCCPSWSRGCATAASKPIVRASSARSSCCWRTFGSAPCSVPPPPRSCVRASITTSIS